MLKLWWQAVLMASVVVWLVAPPAGAEEIESGSKEEKERSYVPLTKGWGDRHWLAQSLIQVTDVRLNPTETGIEVILETAQGKALQPRAVALGRSYIANIPNAVLTLPQRQEFRQDNPASGITRVSVTQVAANSIRVTVTGAIGVPTVELYDSPDEGLIFSFTPAASSAQTPPPPKRDKPDEPVAEGEEIEILVTGEQEETGYSVPNASTATRTDTPIRDIPQSIQVVPQQVIEDRNVRNVTQATETVSNVVDGGSQFGSSGGARIIRGFRQNGNFRNGFRDAPNPYILSSPIPAIQQVEVLKGPASVLFGNLEPGGIVNVVTKQPLSEPYFDLAFEVGNRSFYQPTIDFSGPLNTDKSVLARFVASYQSKDGWQDFVHTNEVAIAPSVTLKLGDNTNLNLYYEYSGFFAYPPESFSILLSDGSLTPRNLYIGYPDIADNEITAQRLGYAFTHKFSENWQIRHNFAALLADTDETAVNTVEIEDDRFATIEAYDLDYGYDNYFTQIDVLGKFQTGSVLHQLIFGFDYNSYLDSYQGQFNTNLPVQDILNPIYDIPAINFEPFFAFDNRVNSYGLYLQDQIAFSDNWKLLIGGRYDWISYETEVGDFGAFGNTTDEPVRSDGAFSPRIGLVYQPIDTVSLYASYSQSFNQTVFLSFDPQDLEPTRGTQYEVGVKTDLLDRKLSVTLAAYHLTKTNVATTDPNNRQFSIQTGEQRSQGIELDIAGEILPGWSVIGSYSYTDAEITEDNTFPVGNQLPDVPRNLASLWTTYFIQNGALEGLGFGLGLFYVGERQGDLDNSFQIEDYFRTDLAIYYRKDRFKAALNIRNLFDTDYVRASSGGRTYLERGAPFTITGSIGWEF